MCIASEWRWLSVAVTEWKTIKALLTFSFTKRKFIRIYNSSAVMWLRERFPVRWLCVWLFVCSYCDCTCTLLTCVSLSQQVSLAWCYGACCPLPTPSWSRQMAALPGSDGGFCLLKGSFFFGSKRRFDVICMHNSFCCQKVPLSEATPPYTNGQTKNMMSLETWRLISTLKQRRFVGEQVL